MPIQSDEKEETEKMTSAERSILAALQNRELTWPELKRITDLTDHRLGLALAKLFYRRLIRTTHRRGQRIYLAVDPPTLQRN